MSLYTYKQLDVATYLENLFNSGLVRSHYLSKQQVENAIADIGLFKFKGYAYTFKNNISTWSIDDILMLAYFDRFLSKNIMDLTLRVEAKIKAVLIETTYRHTHNPFFYLGRASYKTGSTFQIKAEAERDWKIIAPPASTTPAEAYKHYREYYLNKYDFHTNKNHYLSSAPILTIRNNVNYPPFHYFVESATLGTIIGFVENLELSGNSIFDEIAKYFSVNKLNFSAYLYRLNEIRNRCAHNGRIFNRNYRSVAAFSKHKLFRQEINPHSILDVYVTLFYLAYRLDEFSTYEDFEKCIVDIIFSDFLYDYRNKYGQHSLNNRFFDGRFDSLRNMIYRQMGRKKDKPNMQAAVWRKCTNFIIQFLKNPCKYRN